ncbi:radical SAM protein [Hyalangium gracile]|uniref:radical SAM protein n=1 Tax=Hyalangium gracile TaxID=394092 RepID=UPI001CCE6E47|nr:radical SAM protein [Hyalangium gracile]
MEGRYSLIEGVRARIAQEEGTLYKEAPYRVALCYPSPYHVGMSSLGYQTIYRELHLHPGASAERVFLPDDVEAYRRTRTQLFTYESEAPVSGFPMLAFSVAYELELTGFFTMLDLAGLPLLREERSERHPLIVAGGPLTFSNPDPLEPFVDVLVQGEAEELIHTLVDAAAAMEREELLAFLARTPGFRVPGRGGARYFVAKAQDARLPARSQIITPNTELRSMFLIEPERGCSRGCHYCVMRRTTNGGMRTVPPERVLSLIPENARRVGLVGAAVTDHPRIVELLRTLVDAGREVGVSSLRADRLTQELVDTLRRGGATNLTVAADGASQRMRDLVDRKHSEEQIVRAANFARTAGMKQLKVYNVVGLPYEEDADIDELIRFTTELSRIIPVALGVAPFAAKRNTPLDGAPFAGIREVEAKLERLRRGLKGRAEVRPTSARWAWVEYMLAQCGPEAGLATMDAWKAGASFAAFKKAFEARGCVPYLARRVEDGRRNPTVWPTVPAVAPALAEAASRASTARPS